MGSPEISTSTCRSLDMIGKISLVMWLHFNQSYSNNLSMWDIMWDICKGYPPCSKFTSSLEIDRVIDSTPVSFRPRVYIQSHQHRDMWLLYSALQPVRVREWLWDEELLTGWWRRQLQGTMMVNLNIAHFSQLSHSNTNKQVIQQYFFK